jgi:2-(3-amino-3-carboxypropyl)histidine synthase
VLQHVVILADVTYGACCVDDVTAAALDCQLLIHYGHSCLVPLTHTIQQLPVLYVFVEVQFDAAHAAECLVATLMQEAAASTTTTTTTISTTTTTAAATTTHSPLETSTAPHSVDFAIAARRNESLSSVDDDDGTNDCTDPSTIVMPESTAPPSHSHHSPPPPPPPPPPHVYLLGTIQFRHALTSIRAQVLQDPEYASLVAAVSIPQCHPLSPGEVLGCTSPTLTDHIRGPSGDSSSTTTTAVVCFVADGRFHLESTMLAHSNKDSGVQAFYRYDPYARVMTREWYGTLYIHTDTSSLVMARASK